MKKFLILSVFLLTTSCINPSMENGFARLIESLEQLTASFNNLNIPQIQEDMTLVIEGVDDIAYGLTDYLESMEEYNESINTYQEAIDEANDAFLAAQEAYLTAEQIYLTESLEVALEGLSALAEEGNQWAELFYTIMQINITMGQILDTVQTMATQDQVEGILEDLTEMGEGISGLVATSDSDYDGVINSLDLCPNTPIDEISNVNSNGCSPSQLND